MEEPDEVEGVEPLDSDPNVEEEEEEEEETDWATLEESAEEYSSQSESDFDESDTSNTIR